VSGQLPVLSILRPLEDACAWLLRSLHHDLHLPWAWAIVGTTLIVRIVLVPLTVRQIHSMQALQRHAPEMKEIQRKYKGDKQKQQEEMMKFYKENNVNPFASCLPFAAQLPVFISLYEVLKHFTDYIPAASAHGFSWLHFVPDIRAQANSHWSGYLLLAVYAVSQASSMYFMSPTLDKTQRRLMMVLPLFFIFVIAHFPVGVVIYWVTTNLWTLGQGLITRRLIPRTAPGTPPVPAPKRTSRNPPAATSRSSGQPSPQGESPKRPSGPSPPRRVKRKKGGAR